MKRIEDHTSDEGLMRAFQEGSEEAFATLFRRYGRRLFGYVLSLVKDPDTADDVVQKVFVKLSRRPETYRPGGSFSSWIHRVARNAALDVIKSRRTTVAVEDVPESELRDGAEASGSPPTGDPARRVRDGSLGQAVNRALQKLEGIQREALVLREYSDLSYREIAELTGRSLNNVKQDIYQARQFLRAELAPHLGERETA